MMETKYYPVYLALDNEATVIESLGQRFADLLGETEAHDVTVLHRDLGSGKKGAGDAKAKKKTKKGDEKQDESKEDDKLVTLTEDMLDPLRQRVAADIARAEETLRENIQKEMEAAGAQEQKKKGSKGIKSGGGAKPVKEKKKAPPSTKSASKKGDRRDVTTPEVNTGRETSIGVQNLDQQVFVPKVYPPTLPLFVILFDWVKKIGDAEFLQQNGIPLHGIIMINFNGGGNPLLDHLTGVEFGVPTYPDNAGDDKGEGEDREVSLYPGFLDLIKTNEDFQNLGFVSVNVPDIPEQPSGSTVGEPPASGRKSKKGKRDGKDAKASKNSEERQEKVAQATVNEIHISLRQFNQDKIKFEKWKENAAFVNVPLAESTVDTRLYNNLLEKIPEACTTVPLILYCLFEQVAVTIANEDVVTRFAKEEAVNLESFIDASIGTILPHENEEKLLDEAKLLGGPHVFQLGRCTACGQEEEIVEAIPVEPVQICPASIGMPHKFLRGVCAGCGQRQNLAVGGSVPEQKCPATQNRDAHDFKDGYCTFCGEAQQSTAFSGDFSYCPVTMGGAHSYVRGVCSLCGATQGDANRGNPNSEFAQAGIARRSFGGAPDDEPMCPSGSSHMFGEEDGKCAYCDYVDPSFGALPPSASFCPASRSSVHCFDETGYSCLDCGFTKSRRMSKGQEFHEASHHTQVACSGSITGIHQFQDGTCVNCGALPSCPRTGLPHDFDPTSHKCVNCGEAEFIEGANDRETTSVASTVVAFCPGTIGQEHSFKSGLCIFCGSDDPARQEEASRLEKIRLIKGSNVCPATLPQYRLVEPAPSVVVVPFGDGNLLRQAQACMELNLRFSPQALIQEANKLAREWLGLPGIHKKGFPTHEHRSPLERGIELTELRNNSNLAPELFERALLHLNFSELLQESSYDFAFTQHDEDFFYNIDYLHRGQKYSVIEAAVKARLREFRQKELESRLVPDVDIDQEDEEAKDIANAQWNVSDREYREEHNSETLPIVLAEAMLGVAAGDVRCECRYSPLDDTLLVSCRTLTPRLRTSSKVWREFACPDLNFDAWSKCAESVRKNAPSVIYDFTQHTGTLSVTTHLLFPSDQSQIGHSKEVSSTTTSCRLWIWQSGNMISMEEMPLQGLPITEPTPVVAPTPAMLVAPAETLVEKEDEPARSDSRGVKESLVKGGKDKGKKKEKEEEKKVTKGKEKVDSRSASRAKQRDVEPPQTAESFEEGTPFSVTTDNIPDFGPIPVVQSKRPGVPHLSVRFSDATQLNVSDAAEQSLKVGLTTASGLLVQVNAEAAVHMSYPGGQGSIAKSSSNAMFDRARDTELWRSISRAGEVTRMLRDGGRQILYPNGDVAICAAGSDTWILTDKSGQRYALGDGGDSTLLEPLQVAVEIDPETLATVHTRQDLAMFLRYSDGSSLAMHADGTRIYFDTKVDGANKQRIHVECPMFFPVTITTEEKMFLMSDGAAASRDAATAAKATRLVKAMDTVVEIVTHTGDIFRKRFPQGSVYFQKSDGLRLVCCGEGKVAYLPAHVPTDVISPELLQGKFEPEEKLPFNAYIMDLRKGSLDGIDNLQSLIEVRLFPQQYIGQSEVPPAKLVLSRDRQDALPGTFQIPSQYFEAPKPNPPRLFVVRSDGSGCELLPFVRVEPFLRHAEDNTATIAAASEPLSVYTNGNPDASTAEHEPTAHKFLIPLQPPRSYRRQPQIPTVVKAAPHVLTASQIEDQNSQDKFMLLRQLLHYPPLSPELLEQVRADREKYCEWKEAQRQRDAYFRQEDTRSEEEKAEEIRMQEQLRTTFQAQIDAEKQAVFREMNKSNTQNAELVGKTMIGTTFEPAARAAVPVSLQESQTFTRTNQTTGRIEVLKFYNHNPKHDGKPPAQDRALQVRSPKSQTARGKLVAVTGDKTNYFSETVNNSRFQANKLLLELADLTHPVNLAPAARKTHMKSFSAHQRQALMVQYAATWGAAISSIHVLCSRLRPIFDHPHNQALRVIDPRTAPLAEALANSPQFAKCFPDLCAMLGLEQPSNLYLWRHSKPDANLLSNLAVLEEEIALAEARVQEHITPSRVLDPSFKTPAVPSSNPPLDDQDLLQAELKREEMAKAAMLNTSQRKSYEAREARLRQAIAQPAVHERFSASFKPKPVHEHVKKIVIGQRPPSPVTVPPLRVIAGKREMGSSMGMSGLIRAPPQQLPYHQDSAELVPNESYTAAENSAAPKSRTVSSFLPTHSSNNLDESTFPTFAFLPATADFGLLRKGVTYRMTCVLANKGHTNSRFQVQQPDQSPSVHMRVLYRPGMVAPGLERRLEIELCALVEGSVQGVLIVRTEKSVFRLPIFAQVGSGDANGNATQMSTTSFGRIGQVRLFDLSPPPSMQQAERRSQATADPGSSRPATSQSNGGSQSQRLGSISRGGGVPKTKSTSGISSEDGC